MSTVLHIAVDGHTNLEVGKRWDIFENLLPGRGYSSNGCIVYPVPDGVVPWKHKCFDKRLCEKEDAKYLQDMNNWSLKIIVWWDDEGILKKMPFNKGAPGVRGPVLVEKVFYNDACGARVQLDIEDTSTVTNDVLTVCNEHFS